MKGKHVPKADLRREITAWRLLVWAYRDECVCAATNGVFGPDQIGSNMVNFDRRMEFGGSSAGAVRGELLAHEDAIAIDAMVWAWVDQDHGFYKAISRAAERAVPIAPASALPPLRCLPELRANGKVSMLYSLGRRKEALACYVTFEGTDDHVRQRHHEAHQLLAALLAAMMARRFVKWRVVAIGA